MNYKNYSDMVIKIVLAGSITIGIVAITLWAVTWTFLFGHEYGRFHAAFMMVMNYLVVCSIGLVCLANIFTFAWELVSASDPDKKKK